MGHAAEAEEGAGGAFGAAVRQERKKLLSDEARRAKAAADTVGAVKEGPDGVRMGPVTRERERNRSCSPAYPF